MRVPELSLRRIYLFSFVTRFYFYVPVLVAHIERELTDAGRSDARALSLSLIAVTSVGMIAAQYPSGVLADQIGRKPTLVLAGLVQALGTLLFLVPQSLGAIVAAQLLIGVGTAFRNGADTSLLHGVLEQCDRDAEYGGALARMRFFNVLAIAIASAIGGALYAVDARYVFIGAAVANVAGLLALAGVPEAPLHERMRDYRQVLQQSLRELRDNRRARAVTWLGGVANPFFVLAFWAMQTYLVDIEISYAWLGLVMASTSLLQALTMPLSIWLGARSVRTARALPWLLLLPALAFGGAALGRYASLPLLGAVALLCTSGSHVLYRNAVNLTLQRLTPNQVRASVVSMEALVGSLGYVALFPLGGWLINHAGVSSGFAWIAGVCLLVVLPPLLHAFRLGALYAEPGAADPERPRPLPTGPPR